MNIENFLKNTYAGGNMKRCPHCKEYKKYDEFPSSYTKKKNGKEVRRWLCTPCYKVYERAKKNRKIERVKQFIVNYLKDHPCVDCGIDDIRVLEFDHISDVKNFEVSELVIRGSIGRLQKEITLCEVRCANCHRIKTMERAGNWYKQKAYEQMQNN